MLPNLVTSEQLSLLPARSDDDIAPLSGFELAPGGVSELGEAVRAEVSQGVALEPGPEVFDGILDPEHRQAGNEA